MATSQLVNTDSLGDFTEVQPEKLCVRGNPRKGIISVQAGFYTSRDAEFCVPEITDNSGEEIQMTAILDMKSKKEIIKKKEERDI